MRHIILTIPPVFWPKMPPIGLGYLQSFLSDKNIKAEILDLNNLFYNLADESLKKQWLISCNVGLENSIVSIIKNAYRNEYEAAINKLLQFESVGFSCFKSNFTAVLGIIKDLRARNKDIKIILGGPEITRQFLKKGQFTPEIMESADFLAAGEGEMPLYRYLNGENKSKIAAFEQLKDLINGMPFPGYDGLNFNSYPRRDAVALQLSRGCIRRCRFCSEKLLYKNFRVRQITSVIEEIKYHRQHHDTQYFVFFDSLINGDLKALADLCDKIIENFGAINWEAQIAVRSDMKQELFDKMKKSGCYNLFVGLESGCDRTLKSMNKGFTSREALDFFQKMNNSGLSFGISMIVGYPQETELDFKDSLDFIINNKADIRKIEQVNPFTYYDGTDADKEFDYKINKLSLERMEIFIREIKRHNFKYTSAFLGNLIEKDAGI